LLWIRKTLIASKMGAYINPYQSACKFCFLDHQENEGIVDHVVFTTTLQQLSSDTDGRQDRNIRNVT